MPTWSRRKRASASSSRSRRSVPATTTRPELGRSSPPTIIIIVDLPEPDGPTTLTVSPDATASEMPRKTLTAPASLASVRWTSSRRIMLSGLAAPLMPGSRAYSHAARLFNAAISLSLVFRRRCSSAVLAPQHIDLVLPMFRPDGGKPKVGTVAALGGAGLLILLLTAGPAGGAPPRIL